MLYLKKIEGAIYHTASGATPPIGAPQERSTEQVPTWKIVEQSKHIYLLTPSSVLPPQNVHHEHNSSTRAPQHEV
jgi:hypothetical protein